MCVVADHSVGCDIEAVPDELDMDLCRHCFNDDEVASILASDAPTLTFTTLWTQKEALLKLSGTGLHDMSKLPSLHFPPSTLHSSHVSPDRSYVYTVCSADYSKQI
jgi:4'-phosphopantetheinyl transferase